MFAGNVLKIKFENEKELEKAIEKFKSEGYTVINNTKAELGSSRIDSYSLGITENELMIESILFEASIFTNSVDFKELELAIYDNNFDGFEYNLVKVLSPKKEGEEPKREGYGDSLAFGTERERHPILDTLFDSDFLENKIKQDFNYVPGVDEFGGTVFLGSLTQNNINKSVVRLQNRISRDIKKEKVIEVFESIIKNKKGNTEIIEGNFKISESGMGLPKINKGDKKHIVFYQEAGNYDEISRKNYKHIILEIEPGSDSVVVYTLGDEEVYKKEVEEIKDILTKDMVRMNLLSVFKE